MYALQVVLANDPALRDRLVSAVVPPDLQDTVTSATATLPSSGLPWWSVWSVALVGLGIVGAAYETLNNRSWVLFRSRYGFLPRTLRTLAALVLVVVGVAGVGAMTAVVGAVPTVPALSRVLLFVGGVVLTALVIWGSRPSSSLYARTSPGCGLYCSGQRRLSPCSAATIGAALLPGFVARSGPVYGSFATIVGLFALLALVFQAVVIAGEAAVVHRRGLWPRALDASRPTDADRRALTALARQQERVETQRVRSSFD